MRKGGQSQKGNSYENRIAKLFTIAYYSEGDGEFRRAPKSGGWDKRVIPADLVALRRSEGEGEMLPLDRKAKYPMEIDKAFRFSVECKNWKDENVKHFMSGLYSVDSQIFGWMEQAIEDASYSKKTPIVVFKLFGTKDVIEILYPDFAKLSEIFGVFPGKMYIVGSIIPGTEEGKSYVFALFSDFLEWIDWEVYKSAVLKGEIE